MRAETHTASRSAGHKPSSRCTCGSGCPASSRSRCDSHRGRVGTPRSGSPSRSGHSRAFARILGLALVPPEREATTEARIGFPLGPLGLGDDAAAAAASPARHPHEALERRSGRPLRRLLAATPQAWSRSSATSRSFFASPNRNFERRWLAPGHRLLARRAELARNIMRVRDQWA